MCGDVLYDQISRSSRVSVEGLLICSGLSLEWNKRDGMTLLSRHRTGTQQILFKSQFCHWFSVQLWESHLVSLAQILTGV